MSLRTQLTGGLAVLLATAGLAVYAQQADPRDEFLRADARLTALRDTDTVFSMTPFADRAEWEDYAAKLRLRILVSCGLWPEPERTPLNARVFDTIEHEDYSVSKVHFEAFPGFLITGNLYSPKGEGPFPAVLCPHGHWEKGRLEDGERGSVPARGITFARMGIVAFNVDMVGYNDSRQFSFAWGHRPAEVPQDVRRAQELWGIHAFALQLWGNIRALDFLQSLPNVDPDRLACTGASGGGTQTFALCAVDDRVDVAAPVNMISHTMQGGCQCENAPLIRFDASNMEIGALFAPKPLMLVSATGDWTKETPRVEYPAIRSIYELFGVADRVHTHQVDAPHNYNQASREQVYRFFGKWFLNQPDQYANFTEPAYAADPPESVRVFPGEGPLPGHPTQDELVTAMIEERRERMHRLVTERGRDPEFVEEYRSAVETLFGNDDTDIKPELLHVIERSGYTEESWVLRDESRGSVLPLTLFIPERRRNGGAALFVHPYSQTYFLKTDGSPDGEMAQKLLGVGQIVASVDVFRTGASANNERRTGNFSDTFVPTDAIYRVQDVRATIAWLSEYAGRAPVSVVGAGESLLWCALGVALSREYATMEIDGRELRRSDDEWIERDYMPCIQSLGGPSSICGVLGAGRVSVYHPFDNDANTP